MHIIELDGIIEGARERTIDWNVKGGAVGPRLPILPSREIASRGVDVYPELSRAPIVRENPVNRLICIFCA